MELLHPRNTAICAEKMCYIVNPEKDNSELKEFICPSDVTLIVQTVMVDVIISYFVQMQMLQI